MLPLKNVFCPRNESRSGSDETFIILFVNVAKFDLVRFIIVSCPV
jgi:hypothetical protein